MIDVCNIFNPLNKETGNFLIFSQYTNDLSISTVNDKYKVRPSRFMCLDLDSDVLGNLPTIENPETEESDMNYSLPGYFQNQFENGVSMARSKGLDIAGHNFSVAFWTELIKLTRNDNPGEGETFMKLPECIKYVGNIDLESWHNGFADILVDITSGSTKYNVKVNTDTIEDTSMDDFLVNCGLWEYKTDGYISGWPEDENIPIPGATDDDPDDPDDKLSICIGRTAETPESIYDDENVPFFDNIFKYEKIETNDDSSEEDNKFTFNTIILTYDIVDENGSATWSDIPLGIYFTGVIKDEEIDNPVTIYSSREEAYGAGSAWSLRICTRFSPTPHHTLKVEEVAIESGAMDESLSALMSANAEVINTLNTFTESLAGPDGLNSIIRDTYSIFKNSKTNIPTIKTINDKQYWFVNGRNVGEVEAIPMEWDED